MPLVHLLKAFHDETLGTAILALEIHKVFNVRLRSSRHDLNMR